jgi:hypothetical protein
MNEITIADIAIRQDCEGRYCLNVMTGISFGK